LALASPGIGNNHFCVEDDLKKEKEKKEDYLKKRGKNGRRPLKERKKWKTTSKREEKMEDDLKKRGANLSLGWLSFLRFKKYLFITFLVIPKGIRFQHKVQ
jgi:hypothetical protein